VPGVAEVRRDLRDVEPAALAEPDPRSDVDTPNENAPLACVVVVAIDCVPLPYGWDVSVTGSFASRFVTAPEMVVLLP
jgi:hypothetical protein